MPMTAPGLAHAAVPDAARNFSATRERWLARRWEYYRADCLIRARRERADLVDRTMISWKARQRSAVLFCLRAGLPWRTITTHNLDSPFYTEAERVTLVRNALARRESRMGRVKGRVKERVGVKSGRKP
jgi:hypothetical protein